MVATAPDFAGVLAPYAGRQTLKWRAARPGEIPLWLADMDFPVAAVIREELARYVESSALTYGGDPDAAEEALARWLERRHGLRIPPRCTLWMSSVTQGVAASVLALTRPADPVVLCTPTYPPLFRAIREAGREVVAWPVIRQGERFVLDIASLERIARERRPPLVIVSSPHNPTGRVFEAQELRAIPEALAGTEAVVVSDEIFADVVYDGHVHTPFVTVAGPEQAARTVTLWSASKAFNIAGMKCAALICGDAALRARFELVSPCLLGAPGILGLVASTAAWTHGEPWLRETLGLLADNRRRLFEQLDARVPALRGSPPEGTFMGWFDASGLGAREGAQPFLLEHARVDVCAGEDFGPGGEGFIRITFATPSALLEAAIDAIVRACEQGKDGPR